MKEILYIQAGPLANFIGTHFWNTQESYFTYGEEEEPVVYHDRSFREGLTRKVTLFALLRANFPKLTSTDKRESRHSVRDSQFGALSDELYGNADEPDINQWEAGVVEYRRARIPKSDYQTALDQGLDESDEHQDDDKAVPTKTPNIRFWSDFSRVYYHPRTAQKLPDLADWERAEGEWNASRETFSNYEHGHEVMENEVRLFVEECNALQGIQLTSDCGTFGGFTDAFLTVFRDEYPKMPSLAFPLLSNASNLRVSADEEANAMKLINDALCIRSLETLSTINVPLQHPSTWHRGKWLEDLNIDFQNPYHTSALLATHIESVTLPLRLNESSYDISTLSSMLNASATLSISHMSGMYPVPSEINWSCEAEKRIYDLSAAAEADARYGNAPATEYARLQVARGFSPSERTKLEDYFRAKTPTPFSIPAPPYPTPSSFPHFCSRTRREDRHRVLSSLSTSSATAPLLASYATLAQECVDRRADVVTRMGLEFDEMRELKDELWALCDRYAGPDEEWRGSKEDVLSEDEE
ncbi:hypothetical protein ONZ51_g5273 [Trametes cubensis]|uniref:Tubulin nucleotide-binding domain-like protein n=1 Tax=Trametes cubensis TaxID=1111947 RepID=A0AAD7TWJ6_9APHY|nr:hypothetical protein ONZ51_g5273 [Trametes cubensis]